MKYTSSTLFFKILQADVCLLTLSYYFTCNMFLFSSFYQIKYLETEKNLLEKKETELKEIINGLLASREALLNNYNVSSFSNTIT